MDTRRLYAFLSKSLPTERKHSTFKPYNANIKQEKQIPSYNN